jgi:hypothetical protein
MSCGESRLRRVFLYWEMGFVNGLCKGLIEIFENQFEGGRGVCLLVSKSGASHILGVRTKIQVI